MLHFKMRNVTHNIRQKAKLKKHGKEGQGKEKDEGSEHNSPNIPYKANRCFLKSWTTNMVELPISQCREGIKL
jgi:hypothetical protein